MGASRWAPLSGVTFVVLWIAAFLVFGDEVDSNASDAKILAYFGDSGNRDMHVAGFLLILAAGLFFLWFLGVLRGRLVRAEGPGGTLTPIAFGAGLVASALWIAADAFFVAVAFSVDDTKKFHLDPNIFRLTENIGYTLWFSGTTVALVLVLVTSIVSLRSALLPKWLAWLAIVAAASMLVSFFFFPFLIFLGWVLLVSIVLIWRGNAAAGGPQPAAG